MTRAATARIKNTSSTRWKPGVSANPAGRPKGAKNKVTSLMLASAREHFADMVPQAKDLMLRHLKKHLVDAPACGTCNHYIDVIHHYYFGKPKETFDIDMPLLRSELEKLANETGRPLPELEREAERLGAPLLRVVS